MEKLSKGYLRKGTTFDDSYFDALFFDENVEDDRAVTFVYISSQAMGSTTSSDLMTPEIEATILNREDVKYYVKAYRRAYGHNPSDVDIKDQLEHGSRLNGVSWIKSFGIFKVDESSLRRIVLLEPAYARKYN